MGGSNELKRKLQLRGFMKIFTKKHFCQIKRINRLRFSRDHYRDSLCFIPNLNPEVKPASVPRILCCMTVTECMLVQERPPGQERWAWDGTDVSQMSLGNVGLSGTFGHASPLQWLLVLIRIRLAFYYSWDSALANMRYNLLGDTRKPQWSSSLCRGERRWFMLGKYNKRPRTDPPADCKSESFLSEIKTANVRRVPVRSGRSDTPPCSLSRYSWQADCPDGMSTCESRWPAGIQSS